MPINLDSCITGIFVPGNIGASSGQPPVQPTVPSFEVGNYGVGTASGVGSALGDTSRRIIGSAAGTGAATATGSTGAPSDPSFASVKLLLDMQGANGGTTFTDLSSGGSTITASGAHTDTSQFKFGTSSCVFDGTDDLLSTNNLGTGLFTQGTAFTHEGWFRFNSTGGDQVLFSQNASPGGSGAFLRFTGGSLDWFNWSTGQHFSNTWSPSTGVWYHIAFCRDGSTSRMFIDGVALSTTNAGSQAFANDIYLIGGQGVGARPFNGWCGAFRWTRGVGRYTSNFTPPSAPFPTS